MTDSIQTSVSSVGLRRAPLRGTLFVALFVGAACSTQSPDERLKTELRTVSSWAATVRKVGEDWQGGRVPTGYATKTLEAAQTELQKEDETLAQDADIPAAQRTGAQQQIEKLNDAVGQMRTALARADRLALTQALVQLNAAAQPVSSFVGQ
jgi:hypothetical protein